MAISSEQKCIVCGHSSSSGEVICPRCGTIFPEKEVTCKHCGERYHSFLAICPSCGEPMDEESNDDMGREEVLQRFQLIPGVDRNMAGKLYDKGIRSFADLIEMSLPEPERERGLHRIIARKLMLSALTVREDRDEDGLTCARCRGRLEKNDLKCKICGAPAGMAFVELQIGDHRVKLGDYMEELYDYIKGALHGATVKRDIGSEIADAIARMDERELIKQEYRNQIDAWRRKGFDVSELEEILEKDPEGFKERSLKIIRAQVRKEDVRRCPLCNLLLKEDWNECPNCGAKFR